MVLIKIATWFGCWQVLIFLKGCHQPRVGGEIGFKESWLIGCRSGILDHYLIYNGRGAVSVHSLIVMNTLEIENKTQKSFFFFLFFSSPHSSPAPPLNMQQTTRIRAYIYIFKREKKKRATNTQRKSWKERESACKCSNYSSSSAPVMGIPISFNAGLLSQLISPSLVSNIRPKLELCNLQE